MKEKNQLNSRSSWSAASVPHSATFFVGIFAVCYLAVLPMAGTIAFRNVALLGLLVCLAWSFLKQRPSFYWPIPIGLWAAYLFVFPLISDSPIIAAQSLLGQWGRGLIAMLAGAGVAAVFWKKNRGSAFDLGLVTSVPILIHLSLFALKAWETSSIPWGYWGRETHHADLGYAAGQAVVLLAAAMAAGNKAIRPWAAALILAGLLSTAFANSRAGFAFVLGGGLLVLACVYLTRASHQRKNVLIAIATLLIAAVSILFVAIKNDSRWQNMAGQLVAGFSGDAIQIECEGTSSIESKIIAQYGSGEKAQSVISAVQGGDGARMVLLRAGIALAIKHPWGNDGSKHAYQNLLRSECSDPVILMAHAHNGWIDTTLALGWAGAILYLIVLAYFLTVGLRYFRASKMLNEWALVLVSLAAFWIIRGFTDSVFRDHMLEMQGFILAYAAVNLKLHEASASASTVTQTSS
jgi:hypothetical protein